MRIDGLEVKDATKPIIISVKKQDVAKSKAKDPSMCAAAIACRRELGVKDVRIHLSKAYIRENNHWVRYEVPKSLRTEVITFDRAKSFTPDDYELKPCCRTDKLGYVKPTGPKKKNGAKRRTYHIVAGVRNHPSFVKEK